MQFRYKAKGNDGSDQEGIIEAGTVDLAVSALQRRNFLVLSIVPVEEGGGIFGSLTFLQKVKQQDVVVLSRQLATLFEAKVPIVESFKVIISETNNPVLRKHLSAVLDDIQGGLSLSGAMARH